MNVPGCVGFGHACMLAAMCLVHEAVVVGAVLDFGLAILAALKTKTTGAFVDWVIRRLGRRPAGAPEEAAAAAARPG